MSTTEARQPQAVRPWLDVLLHKHECGPSYSDFVRIGFADGAERVVVAIPDMLRDPHEFVLRGIIRSGDLLCLLGWHRLADHPSMERGILMLARPREDGTYVVHVWHELYPWALEHLGVAETCIAYTWLDQPATDDD